MSESLEEQYRFLREKSWENSEEQLRQVVYLNRKVSMENKPRFHTRENHEFLLSRYNHCVYCEKGCRLAERDEINKQEG
jgi:hypothetical protein